jgi:hypothetical protein
MFAFKCDHDKCRQYLSLHYRFILIETEMNRIKKNLTSVNKKSSIILSIGGIFFPYRNTENYITDEKNSFLFTSFLYRLLMMKSICISYCYLLLFVCCVEKAFYSIKNNTVMKDKVPTER